MENYENRISKLEITVEQHSKVLEKQSDKNDALTRLVTLFETQEKVNQERERKQQEQLDKFGDTLEKVNSNLDKLNNNQQQLNDNQVKLGERVSDIESTLQDKKIDLSKLAKDTITKGIPTIITTIILTWLLLKFGLK